MAGHGSAHAQLSPEDAYASGGGTDAAAAFCTWEAGAAHRDSTSPLRPFRDHDGGRPFEIFHVSAAY
jgi:hypothetical protein